MSKKIYTLSSRHWPLQHPIKHSVKRERESERDRDRERERERHTQTDKEQALGLSP